MDIATLLGLAGAFGLIIWSMLQGGTLAAYTNIPGLAIVLGGDELAKNTVQLRDLVAGTQTEIAMADLADVVAAALPAP